MGEEIFFHCTNKPRQHCLVQTFALRLRRTLKSMVAKIFFVFIAAISSERLKGKTCEPFELVPSGNSVTENPGEELLQAEM